MVGNARRLISFNWEWYLYPVSRKSGFSFSWSVWHDICYPTNRELVLLPKDHLAICIVTKSEVYPQNIPACLCESGFYFIYKKNPSILEGGRRSKKLFSLFFHNFSDKFRLDLVLNISLEWSCSILWFIDLLDNFFDLFVRIFW